MKTLQLIYFTFFVLITEAQGQIIDLYLASFSGDPCCVENINFFNQTYAKVCDKQKVVIRIHKYTTFMNYMKANLTEENVKKLVKRYQESIRTNKYSYTDFTHEYQFRFTNNSQYVVGAYLFYEQGNTLDEIIQRLNIFFQVFRKEHRCLDGSFAHRISIGENIHTISKKYNLLDECIIKNNYTAYRQRNMEKKALFFDYENPAVGEIIYIPCFPQVVSEYEKVKE